MTTPVHHNLRYLTVAVALATLPATAVNAQSKAAPAKSAPTKGAQQIVKPAIALAYIDVSTASSDMPGAGMFGAAAQGAQSGPGGGLLGALGGLARGATGSVTGGGNVFGSAGMGFGMGRHVDVSVHTNNNRSLGEATQRIPATMNLGESLKLTAPIPEKPINEPIDEKPIEHTYEKPKGKISLYWGCGDTIRAGQPRTLDVAQASLQDYGNFFISRGSTTRGARAAPGHPHWPNKDDDRRVPDGASIVGQHSFVGNGIPENFNVNLGAAQDLMPAIELSQTKKDGGVALNWKTIPHARGYFIAVMGGKSGQNPQEEGGEMIIWTSSELHDFGFALMNHQSNSNIDKWIREQVVLPASATQCAVPKGIFSEGGGGMLQMIAYGSEAFFAHPPRPTDPKIAWAPDWQAKVRVKSTFMSMLGGFSDGASGAHGDKRAPSEQKPKEEKKVNPVDLLKGLFGR
jgi:hypothetical protein